jgi:cobalt-zinc-cadmium efflux system membrane fusion protein
LAALSGCVAQAAEDVAPKPKRGQVLLSDQEIAAHGVTLVRVEAREVGRGVRTSGRVAFDDLHVAHVFSPVSGRVTRILVRPGTRVEAGVPLAILESPDVGIAKADLAKAEADVVASTHEYERQKALYAERATPKRDYENAEDARDKAFAERDRAKEKAHLLGADTPGPVSQTYTVRAPIAGRVVSMNISPGVEIIGQSGGGAPPELFTIGALDRVYVYADLFDQDFARVAVGVKARVEVIAQPGRSFEGTVEWVSDALDPVSRTAKVRCALDNKDHALLPEMFAHVTIAAKGREALAIPRTAIQHLGEQTFVFCAEKKGGRYALERRHVMVDEDQLGPEVPVLRGLEGGQTIAATGVEFLAEEAAL